MNAETLVIRVDRRSGCVSTLCSSITSDCIERHFDLRDTFVQVCVRAVSVESRPHRDDVVLTRAYRTFRAVWSLVIR